MPQISAPSPLGSSRRPLAPLDGSDTSSSGEESEPDGEETTHTVVFSPPVLGGTKPRPGRGLVLDGQWSVTAEFTTGASVDMVGACGGLICLLDVRTCAVRINDPITGESVDLPPPPCTTSATRRDPRTYCFGFDADTGRYKVVHFPEDYKSQQQSSNGAVVYVHSVGDKYWKPVRVPGAAACCLSAGSGVHSGGAVYWLTHYKVAMARLVRFDLGEEIIASVELPPFNDSYRRRPLYCRLMEVDARPCVVTSLRYDPKSGEPFAACNDDIDVWRLGDDGRWACACGVQLRRLPRLVPGPQAVRGGHVLMQAEDGALHAHRVKESGVARVERTGEKVLVEGSSSFRGKGGAKLAPAAGG